MTILPLLAGLAGGVGLFLLGMWLMTEGLKLAAGSALERVLERSTATRLRGLAAGALVTAMVQSSSAVTMAAIGFVNAGLLSLGQAIWVLFGANVGTTATGWLVAVVGLDFKIEAAALPLVGVGMLLHLTGQRSRRGSIGMTVAGFGILFLGIGTLAANFSSLGADVTLPAFQSRPLSVTSQVLAGALLTVLAQSSSAALAVALTAAQGGLLPLVDAAAVVIGANIGTTATAALAALGATPNAKRAAAAHAMFNVLTGAVALVLLPWLVSGIVAVQGRLDRDPAPAATLALFHTTFNVLGVLLVWPLTNRLAAFLGRRFRSAEEDESRPRHLDENAAAVPELALDALEREVRRLGTIAIRCARAAVAGAPGREARTLGDRQVVQRLNRAIAAYVVRLHTGAMSPHSAERLPLILRVARYYTTVAETAAELALVGRSAGAGQPPPPSSELASFLRDLGALLASVDPAVEPESDRVGMARWAPYEDTYQALKEHLLETGARGAVAIPEMEIRLRRARLARRIGEQAVKAADGLGRLAGRDDPARGSDLLDTGDTSEGET